ncbi:MAG TPA: hypothetical protein VFA89_18640 [Terriglobales bacterium]|nr:hypothetical protein [Terriglobales bacterium]
MTALLGYDFRMLRVLGLSLILAIAPAVHAQIHGVPPSVTSFGPGRGPTPGVPASVTSLGPFGVVPNPVFSGFHHCCFNGQGRHHSQAVFVPYYAVPVYPYYPDYSVVEPGTDDTMEGQYAAGPTIFDRRGPAPAISDVERPSTPASTEQNNQPSESVQEQASSAAAVPVSDQPSTVLVFKDGHETEVKNYAIQGSLLYDLSSGRPKKIALADLDLAATQKENDDRGVDFVLPSGGGGN